MANPRTDGSELKLAGYRFPFVAMDGWIAALRSIPQHVQLVEVRGNVQFLGVVSSALYVLVCPDAFEDTSWALPAVLTHSGGPPVDEWSFACESYGDVLVTYFFV